MNQTIYEEALTTFGYKHRLLKVAEEATELATAALHVYDGRDAVAELAEEAADMEIMLSQLRVEIGDKIDEQKVGKLVRLRKTIDGFNGTWKTTGNDIKHLEG
jgi:phosphoribosyl-ATP pyrophosphohydrolase